MHPRLMSSILSVQIPILTYIGTATYTGGNANPVTLTSASIGTPSPDRLVICVISGNTNAGAAASFNSLTIGGNTATIHVASSGNRVPLLIGSLLVPTGTTANIVVGTAGTQFNEVSCIVFTLTRYRSATPVGSNVTATSSTSTSGTATLDLGAASVFGVSTFNNTNSVVWSSATKAVDSQIGLSSTTTGAATSTLNPRAVAWAETATWGGSTLGSSVAGVSWR